MNTRLLFSVLGIVCLSAFVWGLTFFDKLSQGHNLMLWSLVPAALCLFTTAFYANKHCGCGEIPAITFMLAGAFIALFFFGQYMSSGGMLYRFFGWIGIVFFATSAPGLLSDVISLRRCDCQDPNASHELKGH